MRIQFFFHIEILEFKLKKKEISGIGRAII